MSWQQEISNKLQEAQSIAVLFNTQQALTDEQKSTAKSNVDITTAVAHTYGEDYSITFNY